MCFLVSGMAGLIYQVVWTRYLALFLGHTSYAVVSVLVAFMGGLAVGNGWLGAQADRTRNPLALYGWLEIGIALYAIVFPFYYDLCERAFLGMARQLAPGSGAILALKFLFSLAAILVPTTLMGATFPALTRFVTRALSELREKVAVLYFINSFGAVLGCLVADFWWIPSFGLNRTVIGGAILNLGAGLVALGMSKSVGADRAAAEAGSVETAGQETFSPGELRLALGGIGLSGFVAMLYEVAWTRVLALTLGATTHAFSLMLVTFISGIAVGAWIIYRVPRRGPSLTAFAWAELALAVTILGSMWFYAQLPYWFLHWASLLSRGPNAYPLYELLQVLICFAVMFVPAVCLGLTLPLVSRVATSELARTGRSVGRVFAVNTLGTVAGAVATGLFIMPELGLPRTFALGIAINAGIGLSILYRGQLTARLWLGAGVLAVSFVAGVGFLFNPEWQCAFSAGLWRFAQPPATREAFEQAIHAGKILYYKDGAAATVTVSSKSNGGREILSLKVNGKTDAASAVDVTTQLLLGHIPMFLRPASSDALVVGMGSGMTAAAVARHPSIQHIDVVEISPEVVQAARLFGQYNDHFWENPKIKVTVEDAKSFLRITRSRYDAIISEPSNPWMAGVAGVFSQEYYEDCRSRLKPNGMMVQWVQSYETSDQLLDIVLRTFSSVFPFVSLWESSPADLVLVGSTRPLQVDLDAMQARFGLPAVKADLARMEMVSLSSLLAREAISQQNGAFLPARPGPIHSDFHPILEFEAARAFFVLGRANGWRSLDERYSTRPTTWLGEYLKRQSLTEDDFKALSRFYLEYGLPDNALFRTMVLRWQREQPGTLFPMELMAQISDPVSAAEAEAMRLEPMTDLFMKLADKNPQPLRQYESYLMQTYRAHRSAFNQPPVDVLRKVLDRLLQTDPANQRVYCCHQAEIAWDQGNDPLCAQWSDRALDPNVATGGPVNFLSDPRAPQIVLARRLESLWRSGKFEPALALCRSARRDGFLDSDPRLDLVARKIAACAAATDQE